MSAATLAFFTPAAPPVPLRRGQHQNHALAAWRRSRAVELRVAGWKNEEIARELGYANRGTVSRVIRQTLEAREVDSVDTLRRVECDRLDLLQASLWDRAMQGHLPSVRGVLLVIQARAHLLGLSDARCSADPTVDWPCCQGPAMVVVRPDDCRWSGCSRHGNLMPSNPNPIV
jgi:hypothetical protein